MSLACNLCKQLDYKSNRESSVSNELKLRRIFELKQRRRQSVARLRNREVELIDSLVRSQEKTLVRARGGPSYAIALLRVDLEIGEKFRRHFRERKNLLSEY